MTTLKDKNNYDTDKHFNGEASIASIDIWSCSYFAFLFFLFLSCFSVAKVSLQSQMSVCLKSKPP